MVMQLRDAAVMHLVFGLMTSTDSSWAIYSKTAGVVRVHYAHVDKTVAHRWVDSCNDHEQACGRPAVFWCEEHHPDALFVLA
jgi:hypothetical protein